MKKLFTLLTMLLVGIGSSWATVITEQLTLSPNNGANLIKADGTTVNFGTDAYGSRWGGAVSGIPVSIISANNANVVGTFTETRFQFKNNGNNKFYLKVPDCFNITAYAFTAVYRSSEWGSPTFYEGDNATGTTISSNSGTSVSSSNSFTAGSSFYFYVKHASNENAALTMNANKFTITISFDIDALKTRAEELYAMRGTSGYPADGVNVTTNLKNAIDAITGESSTKTAANCYVLYQAINAYIPFNTTSPDVISINFGSNERDFTGTGGIVSVGNWNNCSGASNSTGFSLNKSDGTSSGATVKWSCKNTWSYKTNVTDDWLVGYLDDGNEISVEVSGIPYNQYSVIIYQATDTKNYGFNPPAINGVYYSWDGRLVNKNRNDTNLKYGTSQNATASLGTNTIKLKGLSGRLIIKGGGNTNSARGCIAGIQIVKETELSTVITEQQTSNITTIPEYIEYAGGAGTSGSRVSINHNGGSVKLTGAEKTYYLRESYSETQTTVNIDGTTVNYSDALGIGKAIYNINNTQITTPKFITSQGQNNRSAVVNLTGNSVITVTGNTNLDGNTSSIMIGHWNGSSNVTLSGTAKIEAVNAQFLVGLTRNNQTITLNENSSITAKGIKVSAGATGTNTLNLNGGSLNLGDVGITAYGNSMAVNVNENTTITATDYLLLISQPITVASGKTLTIDGGESNAIVRLTGSVTNNGTIKFKNVAIEGGEARDCSTLSLLYTYENCTLVINETTADFDEADETITITKIPSEFTSVRLRRVDRKYITLDVDNGTAIFRDSEAKVSGPKCRYDFTFSLETLAERKAEDSSTILNSGSRGSSNGLTYDTGYNSNNSYNNETGLLKVKSTPWRDMTGDDAWPDNYSVAVYANVPDVENGCLMAFGSSTKGGNKYLALIRGASRNEIKLVKGNGMHNAFEVIATMSAENATVAKHLVVFTKSGSTFKVYCDGVNVATTTYSETLGTGFQIGSVHGGVDGTGIIRVNDNNVSSEVRNAVEIQSIRIFDGVLDDDQMSTLMAEFPYVSKGGSYSRTISAYANLGEDNSWAKKDDENTYHIPTPVVEEASTYYPDVTVTTSADATLTVNEDVTFGKTSFGGSGTLTIEADGSGHSINVGGAVIINSNVVVKFGAIDMSTSPVTKGAHANLTFDFSDYNFSSVDTPTDYPVTGNTADYGSKVNGVYPTDQTHTYTLAHNGTSNNYILTVAPTVAFFQQRAIALVSPYYNHIGTGVGKYTISLGETSYANFPNFENAVMSWASLEDCVEPTIAINQPANGFYRFKAAARSEDDNDYNWYIGGNADGIYPASTTKEQAPGANTIFYLENDENGYHLLNYSSGRYSTGISYNAIGTKSNFTLSEGIKTNITDKLIGEYRLYNTDNNWVIAMWNDGIKNLGKEDDWEGWTIEPVDELPVTFNSAAMGYATFFAPVPLQVPSNTTAYICKVGEKEVDDKTVNTLTFYQITNITTKDNAGNDVPTIPANTPVLLYNSTVASSNVTVDFPITSLEYDMDATYIEGSFGTLAAESFDEDKDVWTDSEDNEWDIYSLRVNSTQSKVGFYKKTTGTTLAGFKAWLKTQPTDGARNFVISFDGEGDPTGIVEALGLQNDNVEIYDLNGRKLSSYKKGINIVNGKKVMIQ